MKGENDRRGKETGENKEKERKTEKENMIYVEKEGEKGPMKKERE
jgi:hypothetical protein